MSATEPTAAPQDAAADILDLPSIWEPPPREERLRPVTPPMLCHWGATEDCRRDGRITGLSVEGCFVETGAEAEDGQALTVNCRLPTERSLTLSGRVTHRLAGVGFGVAFTDLSDAERDVLSVLLDYLDETRDAEHDDARAD